MAQDKTPGTKPGNKLSRLRASRLSTNSEEIAVQKAAAEIPASKLSAIPDTPDPEHAEDWQAVHLAPLEAPGVSITEKKALTAGSEEQGEIALRSTFQLPATRVPDHHTTASGKTEAVGDLNAHKEIEERLTFQLPVAGGPETAAPDRRSGRKPVEHQETLSLPTAQVQDAITSGKLPIAHSAEYQETLQLPTPAPVGKPQSEVEYQQTLQLPVMTRRPEAVTSAKIPKAALEKIEDQQTRFMPAMPGKTALPSAGAIAEPVPSPSSAPGGLFAGVRRLIGSGLTRLQEPQPEGLVTRGLRVVRPEVTLGLFPFLTLTNALGLILVSISYYLGQYGASALEFPYLAGLLILFVPNLLRLLSPHVPRFERIYLLCGLGVGFYLLSFMMSPLHISSFDAFLHWITADNLLRTGHLFSNNSLLPVSPYYPGLEIVTNAISTLTGLSTFYASIPLIIAARLLTVLALFLFYEQVTGSSRMAGIATVIYMVNPHFLFFDVMFSYETLALPLTIFVLYLLARYEHVGGEHRRVIFMSWMAVMAVTLTHHMTDYVTDGLLLLWAVVSFFTATSRKTRFHIWSLAIFGGACAVAYAFLVNGNPVWSYLSSYFKTAFDEAGRIISGTGSSRPLFTSTSAAPAPIWDRLLMLGSVAIVAFGLPFGLLTLWRLHRRNVLPIVLGIFSIAYPAAQAFRFTTFGPEIADRSAAFLFLAVAYVLTILITHFWPTRQLNKRTIALISCAVSVMLLGGAILDAGAGFSSMPGPYAVGADGRSIELEGIDAALWTLSTLGPDNRIGTDRTNQILMGAYGDQRIITELGDSLDVSPLFYSTQFDEADKGLLHAGKIHYLVVDMRLSTALPALGFYFVSDEPEMKTLTTPISREALTKFAAVPQINRLFDSGNIVIYDTGAFINGPGS